MTQLFVGWGVMSILTLSLREWRWNIELLSTMLQDEK